MDLSVLKNPCLILIFTAMVVSGLCVTPAVFGDDISDYYCSFEVIGYFPDYWQSPISDVRFDLLTGVVFFSIYPNPDGSLNTGEIDLSRQAAFVAAAHAGQADVSICIGGWGLSDNFSEVTADGAARSVFVSSMVQYCLDHNFDGVVLDWEPVSTVTDRSNYTVLIQELKAALSVHDKTLSVAVFALGNEFYAPAVNAIDRLHIMAYDMGTPHSTYEAAVIAVDHWEAFGFPRSKIILGLPFYGRDANFSYNPYDEIAAQYQPGPEVDEVNGIYFNGIDTIQKKTRFMIERNSAGVMVWELTEDTQDESSLLGAIGDAVHLNQPPDFNCDGTVDAVDLNHLSVHWLTTGCTRNNAWCRGTDMNQSGIVSLMDFVIFASFWMNDLDTIAD
jgi:GH18 family chitinase